MQHTSLAVGSRWGIIAFVTDIESNARILAYFEPRQGPDRSEPRPDFEFDQRVSW